jgi:hypothetical protein
MTKSNAPQPYSTVSGWSPRIRDFERDELPDLMAYARQRYSREWDPQKDSAYKKRLLTDLDFRKEQREAKKQWEKNGLDEVLEIKKKPLAAVPSEDGVIARNIARLMEECGLNRNQMAIKLDTDWKRVNGHLRGNPISTDMLDKYAEVFSTILERRISVADLKSRT